MLLNRFKRVVLILLASVADFRFFLICKYTLGCYVQVGTTSSAAVDPISELGDIAQVCNGPLQLFQPTGHDLI